MDIAPKVDAPRKGDPITAEWAAQVASAANAAPHTPQEPGAFASPFGSVPALAPQNMLGANAPLMPFDCRIVHDSGTDTDGVWAYLPQYNTQSHPSKVPYVIAYGYAAEASSGSVGNPWLKVCDISPSTKVWIFVYFTNETVPATAGAFVTNYVWKISSAVVSGSGYLLPSLPNDAWEHSPIIPIAWAYPGSSSGGIVGGIIQLHKGIVNIGTRALVPYGLAQNVVNGLVSPGTAPNIGYINLYTTGIECGDNLSVVNNASVGVGNGGHLEVGDYIKASEIRIGSAVYVPTSIKDGDGNTIKVLAKQ